MAFNHTYQGLTCSPCLSIQVPCSGNCYLSHKEIKYTFSPECNRYLEPSRQVFNKLLGVLLQKGVNCCVHVLTTKQITWHTCYKHRVRQKINRGIIFSVFFIHLWNSDLNTLFCGSVERGISISKVMGICIPRSFASNCYNVFGCDKISCFTPRP